MCLYPKLIKRSGNYLEDNYRGQAGDKYDIEVYAECGCCSQCVNKKANNWLVRNWYEAKNWDKKCFITLTYKVNPIYLVRKDFIDFIKRFRYEINKDYLESLKAFKKSIERNPDKEILIEEWKKEHFNEYIKTKIFYCGEYGTLKGRPHGHLIIYGWEDNNVEYVRTNKKLNTIWKSNIIEKCWSLGITSYQKFDENEISYISLYSTPQKEYKKLYALSMEKTKKMRLFIEKNWDFYPKKQRGNLLKMLNEVEEELQNEKKRYLAIKEFNGWSLSMGFDNFFEQYSKKEKYVFTEYIAKMEIPTPSPWLKKMANKFGDYQAAEELIKREKNIIKSKTVEEERQKAWARESEKVKKERKYWQETGKNIETEEL